MFACISIFTENLLFMIFHPQATSTAAALAKKYGAEITVVGKLATLHLFFNVICIDHSIKIS